MAIGLLAGMLLTQLDNFFIGTFVGLAALGFYDRAYKTAQWPSTLLNALIARTAFYTYAKVQDDKARLQKTLTMVIWAITLLSCPRPGHFCYGAGPPAPAVRRTLAAGGGFPAFPGCILAARPLMENASSLFTAVGRPKLVTTTAFIELSILVVAVLPATLAWGAIGTCAGVGLAFGTGLII